MRISRIILACVVLTMVPALLCAGKAYALNLKAGEYCFDNSRQHFTQVKMIVGNVTLADKFTQVYDMKRVTNRDWWQATIDTDINNANYFTFVETDVPTGYYATDLATFLDSLENACGGFLRRTNLVSKVAIDRSISSRWVFCPINDRSQSNGYWRPDYSYDATASGSLPIIYLNTKDSVTVASKD